MAARSLTDEELWQYWTNPDNHDRIVNAVPRDTQLGVFHNDSIEEDPESYTPTRGIPKIYQRSLSQPIGKEDQKQYPYQSVGKLFWCRPGTDEEESWATAFYIGDNKIMTAAHAVDKMESNAGVFIPAMIDRGDKTGKNYGAFRVRPESCRKHPKYHTDEYTNPEYDICIAEVGKGKRHPDVNANINGAPGQEHTTEDIMIGDTHLSPIEIHADIETGSNSTLTVLGYPSLTGQLLEAPKTRYVDSESDSNRVAVAFEAQEGMSGGPWMLEDPEGRMVAAGCTAGRKNRCSLSARFTKKLLADLGL